MGAGVLHNFGADLFVLFFLTSIFQKNGMLNPFFAQIIGAHILAQSFAPIFAQIFGAQILAPIFVQIFGAQIFS